MRMFDLFVKFPEIFYSVHSPFWVLSYRNLSCRKLFTLRYFLLFLQLLFKLKLWTSLEGNFYHFLFHSLFLLHHFSFLQLFNIYVDFLSCHILTHTSYLATHLPPLSHTHIFVLGEFPVVFALCILSAYWKPFSPVLLAFVRLFMMRSQTIIQFLASCYYHLCSAFPFVLILYYYLRIVLKNNYLYVICTIKTLF